MDTRTIQASLRQHPVLYALGILGTAWASPALAALLGLAAVALYCWPQPVNETLRIVQQVGGVMRDERLLQQRREKEATQVRMWGMRAEKAMLKPDEAEARKCLERKQHHETLRDRLTDELRKQHAAVEGLRPHVAAAWREDVASGVENSLLDIRARRAEAKREVVLTVAGLRTPEGRHAAARMAEDVAAKEADADAFADLLGDVTAPDEHAAEWETIERNERVTAELDQLRERIRPKGGVLKTGAQEALPGVERARGGE